MQEFSRRSNTHLYVEIALENFNIAIKAEKEIIEITNDTKIIDVEKNYYSFEPERKSYKHSVTTVLFTSMAIEAYIYDYACRNLSDNHTKTYLDKLDIVSKWVVVPKLITGKEFPIERQGFQLLKSLFKYRNSLVHFKSTNFSVKDIEDLQKKSENSFRMASESIRTLIELEKDLSTIDKDEPTKFFLNINECEESLKYKINQLNQ